MSRPLSPRVPRPRCESLGEGGGCGLAGAGPTSHGGGGACGRPARSVRTSESARHRDQRDLRSGRSRAGPLPACEPAASAPSASRAGRRLAASEEGAKSGVPRDTRVVPSRLALTPARERGSQLCAPCRLRRDSGRRRHCRLTSPESRCCAEGEPGGEGTPETRSGRGAEERRRGQVEAGGPPAHPSRRLCS
ncbi:hypothetical protein NN561_014166 [Cricetulus griseus]